MTQNNDETNDLTFLKRIALATGPDGVLNPEVSNAAVDDRKAGVSVQGSGNAVNVGRRVETNVTGPPPACVCGRGVWYSKIERIPGAVASDGSSRVREMFCELWICDSCERERSMPEHPAQPLADAYVRILMAPGPRAASPEMMDAAFKEVFGRETDDSDLDRRHIIAAFRLVCK